MQLPTFDLRLVASFVVVVEERNFGRAAERLFVAQPALSRQIARLEQQLNVQLLDRSGREIVPTTAGKQFLAAAKEILQHARRAETAARTPSGALTVHLGDTYSPRIRQAVASFAVAHPEVRVDAVAPRTVRPAAAVATGAANLGFDILADLPTGLSQAVIDRHVLGVVCAVGHRLACLDEVRWADLQGEIILMPARAIAEGYDALIRATLRAQDVRCELLVGRADTQLTSTDVLEGPEVVVCPDYYLSRTPSTIVWKQLHPDVQLEVGVVWDERTADDAALRFAHWVTAAAADPSEPASAQARPMTRRTT